MVDRVLLGAFDGTYVLRVSRPGYDVKNPALTPNQLSFDSRWQEAGQELMRGSVVFDPDPTGKMTFYYPSPMDPPPVVIAAAQSLSGTTVQTGDRRAHGSGASSVFLNIFTDRFEWRRVFSPEPEYTGFPYIIHYAVYRNVYG